VLDARTLPTTLGGVSVKAGGRDCWVSYVGPGQINVLLPPDLPAGPVDLEVTHPGGTARAGAIVTPTAPGLFASAVPAQVRAGDHVELYATGLGATASPHPTGQVLTQPYPIADPSSIQVFFGTASARVEAVNMTYAGVWQVNVEVPAGITGDVPLVIHAGGAVSNAAQVNVQP
jgi:uncharacterized protein (TIGR03437 family)